MASSLSNLVNNLSEGIHRIKSKFGHDNKKCETYRIKYKYCHCFLNMITRSYFIIAKRCLSV